MASKIKRQMIPFFGVVVISLMLQSACERPVSRRSAADSLYLITQEGNPKYDLKNPEKKFFLPYVLEEISGLSYYKDDIVACVQDEKGRVFYYDLNKEELVHTTLFEYSGDYEGVEIVNETIYIVKSNGDIFTLPIDFTEEKRQAEKFETAFKAKNDIEGLGYDPKSNNLLLVTKDEAGIDSKKDKDSRGVYAFDIEENNLQEDALFIITEDERRKFYKKNRPKNSYDDKRLLFKPSGIAVHPIDGNYYLIASVGKLLMVLSPVGEILESYTISPSILTQPEGICFSPDGTMYISSEGEGDRGYILRFKMQE